MALSGSRKEDVINVLGIVVVSISALAGVYSLPFITATNIFMYYRNKHNMELMVKELESRPNLVDYVKSNPVQCKLLLEVLIDYVSREAQEKKIHILVNGFESACFTENLQDDILLLFFDTLRDMRLLDITCLKLIKDKGYNVTLTDFEHLGIKPSLVQLSYCRLERFGLLQGTLTQDVESEYVFVLAKKSNLDRGITEFGVEFIDFFRIETGIR